MAKDGLIVHGYSESKTYNSILNVPGINRTSPAFKKKLIEVAGRLGTNPDWLATAISFETAGTFDPAKMNSKSHAIGLIQFLPKTAINLGTTTDKLAGMSAEDQLDYVEKYLRSYSGRLNSLNDLYLSILYPVSVGQDSSHVLFKSPSVEYEQNKGFDQDDKGFVTVNDVSKNIVSRYHSAKGERLDLDAPVVVAPIEKGKMPNYDSVMTELLAHGPIEKLVRKAIVSKILPSNNILIAISNDNITNKIEFANILVAALREELDGKATIHNKNGNININCQIVGQAEIALNAVNAICSNVVSLFKEATIKLGNIDIKYYLYINKISSYDILDINTIEQNRRLFKLALVNSNVR